MSTRAMQWVLDRAPGVQPEWVVTLFALANDSNGEGGGSHPSLADLAWITRKDVDAVRCDLAGLEEAGLIRRGDQQLVAHLPADQRPTVWDLALERER